jgi:hypothetical protein
VYRYDWETFNRYFYQVVLVAISVVLPSYGVVEFSYLTFT